LHDSFTPRPFYHWQKFFVVLLPEGLPARRVDLKAVDNENLLILPGVEP
jgi:hypothetical protein